ncbi:hypothetical protein SCB71_11010 [Herbiconiux sp. KACC 21604]|uniref:hypothetical protein n=1 Tax=unclassified Herbiconiux TaxID=2618217 RepID=UPI001490F5E9|nr:hypothetical protein [Herbiconiux sp. SALV-R1]QJU53751.1 hypothetical protein HL652_08960 [Herbiconiux sp. SALV-R1]WPO84755.1 hypothetical protein SCB71_11010 [Herbiconiux sp. KACC 21604]
MGRMRGAGLAVTVAFIAGLSGCSFLPGSRSACLPVLEVAPSPAVAGDSITVTAPDPCEVDVPDGGWEIVVTLEGGDPVLTRTTTQPFDGAFELTLDLPADLPPGQAYVDIANWTSVPCDDTGTSSCASPARPFEVVAPE